jgi:hypothetical protein
MDIVAKAPPGFAVQEFVKEASSNMGFRDGERFWPEQMDPRIAKLTQMVQQLQQAVQSKQMELQSAERQVLMKTESTERIKAAELNVDWKRISGDLQLRDMENNIEAAKVKMDGVISHMEQQGMAQEVMARMAEMRSDLEHAGLKLQEQKLKNQGQVIKMVTDMSKANQARAA